MIPDEQKGERLLKEMKEDPKGWGYIDVGALLAAYGFRFQELGSSRGVRIVSWFWPGRKDTHYLIVYSSENLPPSTIQMAIRLVENVRSERT